MSKEFQVKRCSSNSLRREDQEDSGGGQVGTVEGSYGIVIGQVILAPKIFKTILEHLNLRSLKQVRLVCKSWLREAQTHMIRKGIVCFTANSCTTRIPGFIDTIEKKLPELPQPFQSIDLDFSEDFGSLSHEQILNQLSTLCPPLQVTRFSLSNNTPLRLAFPLITQNSSSLEYLKLFADTCEAEYLPSLDPGQTFPQLTHLEVRMLDVAYEGNHFPSIVAWITERSPRLEVYESVDELLGNSLELASELMLKVDIRNVKTLALVEHCLTVEALEHLYSIPFNRLQHLRMTVHPENRFFLNILPHQLASTLLLPTVTKFTHNLRILDLTNMENLEFLCSLAFPICPNVQELSMFTFPYENNFVSSRFPGLQVLNVRDFDPKVEEHWDEFLPLMNLKTLRIFELNFFKNENLDWDDDLFLEVLFFEKFPSLESLYLHYALLVSCCDLKSNSQEFFSKMLDGVKHLKVYGTTGQWSNAPFSCLAALNELESVAVMSFNESVATIPVKELPLLKVVEFPWDDKCSNIDELLEMGRGVEKVIVTNCCSFSTRVGADPKSKELLDRFFDSLPNAQCGTGSCGDNMPPGYWQNWYRFERCYSEEEDQYDSDDEC